MGEVRCREERRKWDRKWSQKRSVKKRERREESQKSGVTVRKWKGEQDKQRKYEGAKIKEEMVGKRIMVHRKHKGEKG
jgi:hypothetical protein